MIYDLPTLALINLFYNYDVDDDDDDIDDDDDDVTLCKIV